MRSFERSIRWPWVAILALTAAPASAQPVPVPAPGPVDPYGPAVAPPPAPYPAPPPAPPAERHWYGWQTIALGGAATAFGIWASTDDDLDRDPRVGAVELALLGGMVAGPGVHFLNGERSWVKLRRSAQLVMGGAMVGFLAGLVFELAEESDDSGDGSTQDEGSGDVDWERIGVLTFVGLGVGAVVDGAVLGSREDPRAYEAPAPPPVSVQLAPTRGGAGAWLRLAF